MWNIIRMDLHRMIRMKSFYIILFIMGIVCFSVIVIAKDNPEKVAQNNVKDTSADRFDISGEEPMKAKVYIGMSVSTDKTAEEGTLIDWVSPNISAGMIIMLISIFLVLFICSEFTSGFLKNIGGEGGIRLSIIVSKCIVSMLYIVFSNLVCILTVIISSYFLLGSVRLGNGKELVSYIALVSLLELALSMCIIMICNLTRSSALSMVFAFCISCNVFAILFLLLYKVFPSTRIYRYSLMYQLSMAQSNVIAGKYSQAIIVSVVWAVIYFMLSCFIIKKRDIV